MDASSKQATCLALVELYETIKGTGVVVHGEELDDKSYWGTWKVWPSYLEWTWNKGICKVVVQSASKDAVASVDRTYIVTMYVVRSYYLDKFYKEIDFKGFNF